MQRGCLCLQIVWVGLEMQALMYFVAFLLSLFRKKGKPGHSKSILSQR